MNADAGQLLRWSRGDGPALRVEQLVINTPALYARFLKRRGEWPTKLAQQIAARRPGGDPAVLPASNAMSSPRDPVHNARVEHARLVKLSKRMSLALRHAPDRFGLDLDTGGWVPVGDLLSALAMTRADLDAVVAQNDKQRFAVERTSDGVERIRASQGHSVPVDLGLTPATPPDLLFHGTTAAVLDAIRATGLQRGRRHHVHLSGDQETARRVGARRTGTVVVLTVAAGVMARAGHVFYRSANGVWLADAVPAGYLSGWPVEPSQA